MKGLKHGILATCLLASAVPVAALDLFVRSPRDGLVLFGEVEVACEVLSTRPVERVEIWLDGELAATLTEAPYRAAIDVGQENRPHTFELRAFDVDGDSASRTVVTGAVEVHEELDLELQQLYVTVTREGRRVLDLEAEDFQILDDDKPQRQVTFEKGDVPLTAVLLIDSSLSMEGEALRSALAGAQTFVENMAELDEAKVIVFSDRLLAATPFSGDPREVRRGVEAVEASGGTAIHDHLYLALKELESRQGRRVVILLSDGLDVESVLDMADVAWKAGRSQSLIYWIRPSEGADPDGRYFSVWRDVEAYRREIASLVDVIETSGGRIREIGHIDEAAEAFREILAELREQYVLGYYPSADRDDGAWHTVRVRVRPPGLRVRARGGYYDDTP